MPLPLRVRSIHLCAMPTKRSMRARQPLALPLYKYIYKYTYIIFKGETQAVAGSQWACFSSHTGRRQHVSTMLWAPFRAILYVPNIDSVSIIG